MRYHIHRHIELTQQFASWVEADERFELAAPVPLNLVCFRHRGGDDVSEKLMNQLNESGKIYLTHTKLNGRFVLRMAIGQTETEQEHVERAWDLIRELAP